MARGRPQGIGCFVIGLVFLFALFTAAIQRGDVLSLVLAAVIALSIVGIIARQFLQYRESWRRGWRGRPPR